MEQDSIWKLHFDEWLSNVFSYKCGVHFPHHHNKKSQYFFITKNSPEPESWGVVKSFEIVRPETFDYRLGNLEGLIYWILGMWCYKSLYNVHLSLLLTINQNHLKFYFQFAFFFKIRTTKIRKEVKPNNTSARYKDFVEIYP